MRTKHTILLYLIVIIGVIAKSNSISLSYDLPNKEIIQYITDLSREIYSSIQKPDDTILYDSNGEAKLKLFLSPWGELKDAYISESSGNKELDSLCLKAVWTYKRYPPFPETLGEDDLWLDIPIIFDINNAPQEPKGPSSILSSSFSDLNKDNTENSLNKSNLDINEAVDIALENYMAGKVAQEEIELAKLKIREARRALYPASSLNFLETTGKTTGTTQDFTDREYKLKFEYPLYYGWRLKYAVEQAISNMKASTANYDKVTQDLRAEVETAFYSYIANRMNLKLQKALLEDADNIFENAKKRFDLGLTTEPEFLQIETQLKQIKYQVVSSENELVMSRLTLAQAMNVDETDKTIDIIDLDKEKDLEPVDIDVTLEKCMDLAFKYRPDLKSKQYMVDYNDYERKINEAKDQLKVDLTGTYGKSGGAYQSEPLIMDNDWYLGFKVSKPLGGNTVSTSYTKDHTSQKHGQSTRTESFSRGVEIGLLDNLQSFSEKKSAEIGLKKAEDELQQVKDNIIKEVKEAYLNYKKGYVQVMTNLDKIKYKEKEFEVSKARKELNDISLSDFMQANMSLTDEKSFYIEALASMYQSLAKLNKATGFALFLDDKNFILANIDNHLR